VAKIITICHDGEHHQKSLIGMNLLFDSSSACWLAIATTDREAEDFWHWVEPLRRQGMAVTMCVAQPGEAMPWDEWSAQKSRQGLLFWCGGRHNEALGQTARALGIKVEWLPPCVDQVPGVAGGVCPSGQSRM
jgi:hypothetical protein